MEILNIILFILVSIIGWLSAWVYYKKDKKHLNGYLVFGIKILIIMILFILIKIYKTDLIRYVFYLTTGFFAGTLLASKNKAS